MDSVRMGLQGSWCSNQDVVHVDDDTSAFGKEAQLKVFEYLIHHGLKGAWWICQTEEHDLWFKKAIFGLKCCILFIAGFDPDVVISPLYVEFGKDMSILYLADEIGDEW